MQEAIHWKPSINRSGILLLIVYCLSILLYCSGLHQKLYLTEDNRIKFHAIPIAISTLYQGHKHNYSGWRSTELPFQGAPSLLTDAFLFEQLNAPVDEAQGHYYWVADDRGYADFVIAAFALFGPYMKSLYHFWFVLFLLSITLFTLSFRRHVWAMAILALVVLGIHSSVALLKLIPTYISIYEPRYLDVLALVPVFHMIFAAVFFKNSDFRKHCYPLLGQLFLFIFLFHARSSLGWEIVAITGISLFTFLLRKEWNKISPPLVIIVCLFGSILMLNGYKHLKYDESYFKDMGVRTFWHNALMGLNLKTMPAPKDLMSDYKIAQLVTEYAKNTHACASCIQELEAQTLLNTLGNWGSADWVAYEKCARKFYFSLVREHKWETIKLYLFDKPLQTLIQLKSPSAILFSNGNNSADPENIMPSTPFHLLYLTIIIPLFLLSIKSLFTHRWKLLGITLALFITSMIPSIAFYSDILTRGGSSAVMAVLLYLGMAFCLFTAYQWITASLSKNRKASEVI